MPTATSGPLTETVFYILLALSTPLHGYGVMQRVSELSDGRVSIGPGTLYGALNSLVEKGWIVPVVGEASDRKKEYVVTDVGHDVVRIELGRLEELLRNGRAIANRSTP